MHKSLYSLTILSVLLSCNTSKNKSKNITNEDVVATSILKKPFDWKAANIYFLLTDRFNNGSKDNDINFNRTSPTGPLRGFMGGDLKGISQKIDDNYFSDLGINAIWFSPIVEQIHGSVDESTGNTYGFHGYWTKDWTAIDPNFGTDKDLEELISKAHKKGIRILMDVVLNHTGPVTELDPVWPMDWVRTNPACNYTNYISTTACTLVENLPDIKTESQKLVSVPEVLITKWKKEGRLQSELDELELFFKRTGYPRTPRYYIIKWLTDYVNDFGIDGFRVDTVKHVNEDSWMILEKEARYAHNTWKRNNPTKVIDTTSFYMVGEVYNYGISNGRNFDFGDKKVDYFSNGFSSIINFELKYDATKSYEDIFSKYDSLLQTELKGKSVVNYLTSHDDGSPFDPERLNPNRAANILLLTPGASQIYYGDETARDLTIEHTIGDATLRSFMNWEEIDSVLSKKETLLHWQKLGSFRNNHLSIGAGKHKLLNTQPYTFSRTYTKGDYKDKVVVALDVPKGEKIISVKGFFKDGSILFDTYSGTELVVTNGNVTLNNNFDIVLLEEKD